MLGRNNVLPIRRVIRRNDTGKFYAGPGQWVDTMDEGKEFYSFSEIVNEKANLIADRCFLVMRFDGVECDAKLPF